MADFSPAKYKNAAIKWKNTPVKKKSVHIKCNHSYKAVSYFRFLGKKAAVKREFRINISENMCLCKDFRALCTDFFYSYEALSYFTFFKEGKSQDSAIVTEVVQYIENKRTG